jgi:hypothetical protein
MKLPRRYRVALAAYPAGYRESRGAELAATLADGDDERGGPSMREAAALAGRGLAMRLGAAGSGQGLLVVAAVLILATLLSGFTWAERVFLFRGEAAAFGTDAPGIWWTVALGVSAWVVLAAGPMGAVDDPRRRRMAVLLAAPVALATFIGPGTIVTRGLLEPAELVEFVRWIAPALFHNWTLTLPAAGGATLGTWIALRALGRLGEPAGRRAMAAVLVLLGGAAVLQVVLRPDLPAEYAQSAFADLGTATFLAALAVLVSLSALVRLRPHHA